MQESNIPDERVKLSPRDDFSYAKVKRDGRRSLNNRSKSVSFKRSSTIPKTESFREQVNELKTYIICPWYRSYRIWWVNSVICSVLTIFFETYEIAFATAGLNDGGGGFIVSVYVFNAIFVIDIAINFNLAYYNERDELVIDRQMIARKYFGYMFWVDLIGVVPFYIIVLRCTGLLGVDNTTTQYLALLRLLRMVRLRRVVELFEKIKYSSRVSLMTVTLVRNYGAALVWTHFAACVMYFIARQYGFDEEETWIGGALAGFDDRTDLTEQAFERYLTSMYWSIVTFTTVGYGDFSPVNSAEQIWGMVYMFLNMVLTSWMIGSITLLIVKNDEATGKFRDSMKVLDQYSTIHNFDKDFKKSLKRQIDLDFKHRDTSDEVVLKDFPSTTRRKVLHKLYLPRLKHCRLMWEVPDQFMDALFRVCKVEMLSPGEDIVQRGTIAADLYFLLEGKARVISWEADAISDDGRTGTTNSVYSGESKPDLSGCFTKRRLRSGVFINEISFFTETPQSDTVRTSTLCKTLTLPRFAYKSIVEDHPACLTKVLNNLLSMVEEKVQDAGGDDSPIPEPPDTVPTVDGSDFDHTDGCQRRVEEIQAEVALRKARDVIAMHINKQKDDQVTKFLFAASRDDTATIRLMLDQSFDPNNADYDKRTALMVAAMKGNCEVLTLLLEYHANPNLLDIHGTSALLEATRHGHEESMELLLCHGAKLGLSEMESASTLCQAVFDGDMIMLQRLVKGKINLNASDYDKRTAGHIAAADGNLAALKILIRYGADVTARDRWGFTIQDEAERQDYKHILQYLKSPGDDEEE